MAVVYKHFVFVQLLLILVLHIAATRRVDAAKGYFRSRDFTGYEIFRPSRAINRRQNRRNPSHSSLKQSQEKDTTIDAVIVTAQTGSRAILHCDTRKLESPGNDNMTVIWIRRYATNFSLLTDGEKVLTDDKRVFATNKVDSQDWMLHIRYTQTADEGLYQCQICSNWKPSNASLYVKLKLIEAQAIIIGGPEKHVEKVGSPLRLSCVLNNSIEPPKYIFWYHGDRMINYDLNDGATVRYGRQGSELIFPGAQEKHAGNYSCVPSNARQASVSVIFPINKIPETALNKKSSGQNLTPQNYFVSMLVLTSTFHLFR